MVAIGFCTSCLPVSALLLVSVGVTWRFMGLNLFRGLWTYKYSYDDLGILGPLLLWVHTPPGG